MMEIKPNHTVTIDDLGFYAENPKVDQPWREENIEVIKLVNAPPKKILIDEVLRKFTFNATISGINQLEVMEKLEQYKPPHICHFSSIHAGAYNAYVIFRPRLENCFPDTVFLDVTVEEVES